MTGIVSPRCAAGVAALLLTVQSTHAEVRLPRLLGDGVILQRDAATTIRGRADEGETVTVYLDDERIVGTRASDGRWQVELGPVPAGGPHTLTIEGENAIVVDDVWFGDVWVASGQSNMELTMSRVSGRYAADVAAADYPLIRQFDVPRGYDFHAPREDLDGGEWVASTPETVHEFSAVAWFFARELHERHGVPIGILSSNYGGSTAEGWMSEEALEAYPHYLEIARSYRDENYLSDLRASDQSAVEDWHAALDAKDAGLQGDVPWHAPRLDDSGWPRTAVPGGWADSAAGPVNGAVWFRRDVELPPGLAGKAAALELGRIVDADVTYVNGTEVGATTYQYPPRRYRIPPGLLRAGTNTIAVRVVSSSGEGGFVEDKPYELRVGSETIDLAGEWRYRVGAVSEPLPPPRFIAHRQPLGFYNAMLAPLQATTIRGVIWYQGESNVGRAEEYARLFPAMIRDWRRGWGQGDFPFLFVQLANYLEPVDEPTESAWAELRDAQLAALCEPNTAGVVAIDLGEWNDIHPENKKDVGERLALAARRMAYGERDIVSSGPMLRALAREHDELVLDFDHAGSGLLARGDRLHGFAVAGADGVYRWGSARIDGGRVVVRHEHVSRPVAVRYAWADNPVRANLYNREGLPAWPFEAELPARTSAVRCTD